MARPTFLLEPPPPTDAHLLKELGEAVSFFKAPKNVMAQCLGVSPRVFGHILDGRTDLLQSGSKPWELACLFLELYRCVKGLGFDQESAARWFLMSQEGSRPPVELIQTVLGLVSLLNFMGCRPGNVISRG